MKAVELDAGVEMILEGGNNPLSHEWFGASRQERHSRHQPAQHEYDDRARQKPCPPRGQTGALGQVSHFCRVSQICLPGANNSI